MAPALPDPLPRNFVAQLHGQTPPSTPVAQRRAAAQRIFLQHNEFPDRRGEQRPIRAVSDNRFDGKGHRTARQRAPHLTDTHVHGREAVKPQLLMSWRSLLHRHRTAGKKRPPYRYRGDERRHEGRSLRQPKRKNAGQSRYKPSSVDQKSPQGRRRFLDATRVYRRRWSVQRLAAYTHSLSLSAILSRPYAIKTSPAKSHKTNRSDRFPQSSLPT